MPDAAPRTTVAVVTPVFPPQRGGIGRVAETDASQLAAAGFSVTAYAPRAEDAEPGDWRRYAVRRLRAWPRWGHAAFAPLSGALLRRHGAVLLHFPAFGIAEPLLLWRLLAGRGRRRGGAGPARLAVTYHMDTVGGGPLVRLFSWPTRLLAPRLLRAADLVLVTSLDYARHSRLAALLAAEPDRFRELPPGVDAIRFSPAPAQPSAGAAKAEESLRARLGLAPGDKVVAVTGGLDRAHYFKGLPVLLRAFASDDLAGARLLVIGDGDRRAECEAQAAALGPDAADRVVFAGALTDAELPVALRLASVFAFPSTDRSEAFGIAALEAMACGLPVVASDLPGVRTVVRQGSTGVLVRPGSASALALALARLLGDDALRARMGAEARAVAEREYALPVRARRLAAVMAELGA